MSVEDSNSVNPVTYNDVIITIIKVVFNWYLTCQNGCLELLY